MFVVADGGGDGGNSGLVARGCRSPRATEGWNGGLGRQAGGWDESSFVARGWTEDGGAKEARGKERKKERKESPPEA